MPKGAPFVLEVSAKSLGERGHSRQVGHRFGRLSCRPQVSVPWLTDLGGVDWDILPRPRGGDWLRDETMAWREAGLDVVVSLLEPEEAAQLVLEDEAAAAAASGIAF